MMWAILGEIEFEVLNSPSGWAQRFSASFVEHERIAGKPRHEAVGGEPEEITWDILLHERLHDVQARLRAIREATAAQEPLALVLGDGTWLGPWLIVEGTLTARKTTAGARLISAELQLVLRQYSGEFTAPAPRPAVAPSSTDALAAAPVQPGLLNRVTQTLTNTQALAHAARQAENTLRNTSQMLRWAQPLPVAAAMTQVPTVLGSLAHARQSVAIMQNVAVHVHEAQAMTQLAANLAFQVQAMAVQLRTPQPGTVLGQLANARQSAQNALNLFSQNRSLLLQITADVAMRRR